MGTGQALPSLWSSDLGDEGGCRFDMGFSVQERNTSSCEVTARNPTAVLPRWTRRNSERSPAKAVKVFRPRSAASRRILSLQRAQAARAVKPCRRKAAAFPRIANSPPKPAAKADWRAARRIASTKSRRNRAKIKSTKRSITRNRTSRASSRSAPFLLIIRTAPVKFWDVVRTSAAARKLAAAFAFTGLQLDVRVAA